MKILVTGANGFIGSALCSEAVGRGIVVRGAARSPCSLPSNLESHLVGEIDANTDWQSALLGCDSVVHLAARAHVSKEAAPVPLQAFREVNFNGTLNLARQAVAVGVKRFVFISSIGVNGAATSQKPFSFDDDVAPHTDYALSKYEAEVGLREIANKSGMEVVIIRPPLVYGPKAPGNFSSLVRWVGRGVPLPLGSVVGNRRSLVALDNLVDLILVCVMHPNAANQTFLVSDGEDISTAELLHRVGRALKRPARLLNVPVKWLSLAAKLFGKKSLAQRLLGNLQVDISHTCQTLGWKPPIGVDEGLRRVQCKDYVNDTFV